jgi:YfiH family protein
MTCLGAVFSTAGDGDLRADLEARRRFSARAGIAERWATARQVHGTVVARVDGPGDAGEADALFTTRPLLPLAVFTADCFGVALLGPRGVGIAHAGWRGASSGVVGALRRAMDREGVTPERACIGPGIRSCCFEVGPEVRARFEAHQARTTWGTPSVDIVGALRDELAGLEVDESAGCTRCGVGYFSHRRDGTRDRMAGVVWLE